MLTQEAAKTFLLSPLAPLFDIQEDPPTYKKIKGKIYITCDGVTKTISEWAEQMGINRNTLYSRIYRGWDIGKALHTPVKKDHLNTAKAFFSALLAS